MAKKRPEDGNNKLSTGTAEPRDIKTPGGGKGKGKEKARAWQGQGPRMAKNCLLYTSDAADE